ncbi:MAG: YraN family protein [Bacillota bacterium]|nr:YraN family protein [Bacillota bacterium]
MNKVKKGKLGEERAISFLLKQGYQILEQNFRGPTGEIDIVAQMEKELIFVEVKTRKSLQFGTGREAVDIRKQNRIRKTAQFYLIQTRSSLQPRFDVIEIYLKESHKNMEISHLKGVF